MKQSSSELLKRSSRSVIIFIIVICVLVVINSPVSPLVFAAGGALIGYMLGFVMGLWLSDPIAWLWAWIVALFVNRKVDEEKTAFAVLRAIVITMTIAGGATGGLYWWNNADYLLSLLR